MGTTLESIYSDIYPKENITNIYQQIEFKLDSLNNEEVTKLSKTINLLKSLSESLNILEVNYSETGFQIKCLFNNDAEESIFVNQQNRLNYNLEMLIAKQRNWEKLQLLVMNYKFSNRELILLKALTAIVLLFAIIYGTSYVSNEITKSKNSLFSEVNKFNETKQLLAQIKVLENNKNLEVSANDF